MSEPACYTVDEFCTSHRICRATLYALWKQGLGPRYMMVGSHRRISAEAAADWRREREAASNQAAA